MQNIVKYKVKQKKIKISWIKGSLKVTNKKQPPLCKTLKNFECDFLFDSEKKSSKKLEKKNCLSAFL